ncbi:MAG TPA: hypothetical protein VGC13_01905 [Longimicrobium sp.]|jgi:hypothetical protein|uniref:hypothetical protein n=1 Tax=Longimicrobium sp. TaxID=2029185 RepID=UPI002EDB8EEE
MQMKNSLAAALSLAALLAAAPAAAQSDNTGPVITGSEVARTPAVPTRDLEGALFRNAGGRTAFRSRAIADAVTGETATVCTGGLERPEHWPRALELDPAGECVACTLLRRPGLESAEAQAALRALRGGAPGRPGDPAEVLVAALAGLADERPGFVDERGRYVDGARWEAAIVAYEAYMESAPDALLDSPPPVLVAIAIIMDRLVDAGLAAAER